MSPLETNRPKDLYSSSQIMRNGVTWFTLRHARRPHIELLNVCGKRKSHLRKCAADLAVNPLGAPIPQYPSCWGGWHGRFTPPN